MMREPQIEELLEEIRHFRRAIEPGIAYGIKMILAAKETLKVKDLKKINLFVVVETTHCLPDAIQFLSGCTIGNRRLIVRDHGKMAATFIARDTDKAIRITISPTFQKRDAQRSREFMQLKRKRKFAEIESRRIQEALEILEAPNDEMLRIQEVEITEPFSTIFIPTAIVICEKCGESVREGKIRIKNGKKICSECAGVEKPYYRMKYGGLQTT
jgi:formylmethanofuran dehydrogenase subunit E